MGDGVEIGTALFPIEIDNQPDLGSAIQQTQHSAVKSAIGAAAEKVGDKTWKVQSVSVGEPFELLGQHYISVVAVLAVDEDPETESRE